jgi:zinc transport system substrate-binding protein
MFRLFPALLGVIFSAASYASPKVLVSIKPIHSLVAAVMEGVAEPELLITNEAASPHTYMLLPSDALKLERAEVIFWVGESYETFLTNRLSSLEGKKIIRLMDSPGLTLYSHRQGGLWEEEEEDDCDTECHAHGFDAHPHHHDPLAKDGHIWLAPNNAQILVAHIAKTLAEADPDNAPLYSENAEKVKAQLDDLIQELMDELKPIKDKPYILVHDFIQYFDRFFGTRAIGVIRIHPEIEPSIQHIIKIQKQLDQPQAAICLFAEPQFDSTQIQKIAKKAHINFGQLDYLGTDLEAGKNCYFEIMRRLASNLKQGLIQEP